MATYQLQDLINAIDRAERASNTYIGVASSQSDFVQAEFEEIKTLTRRIQDHLDLYIRDYEGEDGVSVESVEINEDAVVVSYSKGDSETFTDVVPSAPISITNYTIDQNGELVESTSDEQDSPKGIVIGFDGRTVETISVQENGTLLVSFLDGSSQFVGNIDNFGEDPITSVSIIDHTLFIEVADELEEIGNVRGQDGVNGVEVESVSYEREVDDLRIFLHLDNGQILNAGLVALTIRSVEPSDSLESDFTDGVLRFFLPSGEEIDLGQMNGEDGEDAGPPPQGEDGEDGTTISNARFSSRGLTYYVTIDGNESVVGNPQQIAIPPGEVSIESHEINDQGDLIFNLNIGVNQIRVNCGRVRGQDADRFENDADDGITITEFNIVDGEIIITILEDGETRDEVIGFIGWDKITNVYRNNFRELVFEFQYGDDIFVSPVDGENGLTGNFINQIDFEKDEEEGLFLTLQSTRDEPYSIGNVRPFQDHSVSLLGRDLVFYIVDDQEPGGLREVNVGVVVGEAGANLENLDLTNGTLTLEFDEQADIVADGQVRYISGVDYSDAEEEITFSYDDDEKEVIIDFSRPEDAEDGDWITDLVIGEDRRLTASFEQAPDQDLGIIDGRWITAVDKDGEEYTFTWNVGDSSNVTVFDIDGDNGVWITEITRDENDFYVINYSNETSQTIEEVMDGRWITDISLDGESVSVQYTNEETPTTVGEASGINGVNSRYITDMYKEGNDLFVSWTDDTGEENIGRLDGRAPQWITDAFIDSERNLVVTYDGDEIDTPFDEIIGPIDFSYGMVDIRLNEDQLEVEMKDESVRQVGQVLRRLTDVSYDEDDLTLHTNHTDDIELGNTAGQDEDDGRLISDIRHEDQRFIVTYDDETEEDIGAFPRVHVVDGELVGANDNELTLILTDGTEINLGNVRGDDASRNVVDAFINAQDELVLTFNDIDPIVLDNVRGADGIDVDEVFIDEDGFLIIRMTDLQEFTAGFIRRDLGFTPYDEFRSYAAGESVIFNGRAWVALEPIEAGVEPSQEVPEWGLVRFGGDASPDASRPDVISPRDNVVFSNLSPFLLAGRLRNNYSVDSRETRRFQIDLIEGNFTDPVYDQIENNDGHQVEIQLDPNAEYKWRCRDTILETGYITNWSLVGTFTVEVGAIDTPTVSVDGDPLDVGAIAAFETGPYSGTGVHISTSWQIRRDSDGEILYEDIEGSDLTQKAIEFGILTENDNFSVRVRFFNDQGDASAWSSWSTFTTRVRFDNPLQPVVTFDGDDINATVARPFFTSNSNVSAVWDEYMARQGLQSVWEVYEGETLVWGSASSLDIERVQVGAILSSGTEYRIRVRYQSDRFTGPSEWSDFVSFTPSWNIEVPTVQYDGGDLNFVLVDAEFSSSSFVGTNDSFRFLLWEVRRDDDDSLVYSGNVSTGMDLSWIVEFDEDDSEQEYNIRAKMLGRFGESEWGERLSFRVQEIVEIFTYSGSDDDTVRKIDPQGNEVWSFTGHSSNVRAVSVDTDGFVYIGSWDSTVKKIDPDGNEVWSFEGHGGIVNGVAVDADGYVYSGSTDNTVKKIDPDGNEVWSFTGHSATINGVAVDVDGYVYSASQDETVRKIDPDGNEVWSFTGHSGAVVNGVAVDDDGYVYSGAWDNTVRKIDPQGNEVWSFGTDGIVWGVAVDADGFVYCGSADNTVRKIDPDGNEVWSFTGHSGDVNAVAVDADGYVYSGSNDNTVKKIDPQGNEVWSFTGHSATINGVAVTQQEVPLSAADTDGTYYSLKTPQF